MRNFSGDVRNADWTASLFPIFRFEERDELLETANGHGIEVISLIAPTSKERIRTIAKKAQGFIYLVSSMGRDRNEK